jgi:hypothetical protein
VIAEHREDGRRQAPAGVGEHPGLLDLTRRREVAGEQDHVGLVRDALERLHGAPARRLGRVDVAGRRDADHGDPMLHERPDRKRGAACHSRPSTSSSRR